MRTDIHIFLQKGHGNEMKKQIVSQKFGERVKAYRIERRYSQEEVAFRAEISTIYYGRVERGERCPTIDTLMKLSGALGVSPAELLDFDESDYAEDETILRIKRILKGIPAEKQHDIANIIEGIADLIN